MPVMRSFSSFASTPNAGSAFTSGAGVAQRIAEAAAELQLGRQKLQAESAQAAMELAAKRETSAAANMRQQQELEMEKAYRDAQIGLKERELGQAEQLLSLKTQEAAQQFEASQLYQRDAQEMITQGATPEDAYMQAALKYGPQMGLPGSVYTQAFSPESTMAEDFGQATPVEGLDPERFRKFRTGEGSFQLVRLPDNMEAEGEAPPGYIRAGDKLLPEREPKQITDLKKERARLVKLQDDDTTGQMMSDRAKSGEKKLTRSQQMIADRYEKRASEIRALDARMEQAQSPSSSGTSRFQEGQRVRNRRNGKMYRIENGEPVEIQE